MAWKNGVLAGIFWILTFFGFLSSAFLALAEFSPLVISEIHPTQEFVEIQNISDENVDCSAWKISEETSSGTEIFLTFPPNSICESNGFLVIPLSRKINDTGDTVRLYNENNEKKDEIFIPAKVEGKSFSRNANGNFSWNIPSEGFATPPPPVFDAVFRISEMLANPIGTDSEGEFFEIQNTTHQTQNLKNWSIADESGKVFVFAETEIPPNGFAVFFAAESKITLNNDAETLTLFDPNGEKKDEISFSQDVPEGASFAFFPNIPENFAWTQDPTPNAENVLVEISIASGASSSSSSNNSVLFAEKVFSLKTTREKNPVLKIVQIAPSEKNDFVEIFCEQCDMDLEGIRLGMDTEVFRIPPETFVKTGEKLRFIFEKDTKKLPEKTENGWKFFVPESGITATDETIYVGNEKSEILDAVCFANQNGSFSSGEKTDFELLKYFGAWNANFVQEYECIRSESLASGIAFHRFFEKTHETSEEKKFVDTNTKADFFLFPVDFSSFSNVSAFLPNKKTPKMVIENIAFFEKKTVITLQSLESLEKLENETLENNENGEKTNLAGFFVEHNGKRLFNFFDPIFVDENEKIFLTLPSSKIDRKKMVLSLKNAQGEELDGLCFAFSRDDEKTLGNFVLKLVHMGIWKTPLSSHCIAVPENGDFAVERKNFAFPSSAEHFAVLENLSKISETAEKKELENENGTQKTKKSSKPKILEEIAWERFEDFVIFSGKLSPENTVRMRFLGEVFSEKTTKAGKFSFKIPVSSHFQNKNTLSSAPVSFFWENPQNTKTEKFKTRIFLPSSSLVLAENFSWHTVLPNPKGKDSGSEKAILHIAKGGWLNNIQISNGKSIKKIPLQFVENNTFLEFSGKELPSLKNSNSGIFLQTVLPSQSSKNKLQNVVFLAKTHWKKARDNEWFGKFAPVFVEIKKIKKSAKKTKKNPSVASISEKIEQKIEQKIQEKMVKIFRFEADGMWFLDGENLFFQKFSGGQQVYPFLFSAFEEVKFSFDSKKNIWDVQKMTLENLENVDFFGVDEISTKKGTIFVVPFWVFLMIGFLGIIWSSRRMKAGRLV